MAEAEPQKLALEERKIVHMYPLVRFCDMSDEIRSETIELCVTACEKHPTNNELAARMIKETMDKKLGPSWHVVVGEGFGFEVSYECKNLLYMFFGGNLACCIWKCSKPYIVRYKSCAIPTDHYRTMYGFFFIWKTNINTNVKLKKKNHI